MWVILCESESMSECVIYVGISVKSVKLWIKHGKFWGNKSKRTVFFVCLSFSVFHSFCLSFPLSVYLSFCLSSFPFVCLAFPLSVFFPLSVCLS